MNHLLLPSVTLMEVQRCNQTRHRTLTTPSVYLLHQSIDLQLLFSFVHLFFLLGEFQLKLHLLLIFSLLLQCVSVENLLLFLLLFSFLRLHTLVKIRRRQVKVPLQTMHDMQKQQTTKQPSSGLKHSTRKLSSKVSKESRPIYTRRKRRRRTEQFLRIFALISSVILQVTGDLTMTDQTEQCR